MQFQAGKKKKAVRVVMVTGAYFPEVSGAGLQCRSLIGAARALADDLAFTVVTTSTGCSLPFHDRVDGVEVYRLPADGKISGLFKWPALLCYLFFRVLAGADIIHLHGFSRKSYFFVLAGLLTRKKVLLKMSSLGEDDPPSVMGTRGRFLRKRFYRLAHCYLAPGPALESAFRASGLGDERLAALPNGVDCDRFKPVENEKEKRALRIRLGLPETGLLVLFVGHFSQDKRPALLAWAWRELQAGEVGLVMVGATDPEAYEVDRKVVDEVKRVAARAGENPGSLVLVERTGNIEEFFRACDIFALPSVREGLPNALLEAMACGLACVATRLPGVTDHLIWPDAGVLVEPDQVSSFTVAIKGLVRDSSLRKELGARARKKILDGGFELREVAARYRELYLQMVSRETSGGANQRESG
ncbi:MAG: glycosyltransferase family 4 protein [Gemmatimonadota bacterium]|nr:glycosyltransferase family 4 protein [Gemmatimonadota bacterium]